MKSIRVTATIILTTLLAFALPASFGWGLSNKKDDERVLFVLIPVGHQRVVAKSGPLELVAYCRVDNVGGVIPDYVTIAELYIRSIEDGWFPLGTRADEAPEVPEGGFLAGREESICYEVGKGTGKCSGYATSPPYYASLSGFFLGVQSDLTASDRDDFCIFAGEVLKARLKTH